jgi:hypothetical protein
LAKITSIYGGRAQITFHEGKHFYTCRVNGVPGLERIYQAGTTSVVGKLDKPALVPWAAKTVVKQAKRLIAQAPAPLTHDMVNALLDAAEDTWRDAKDEAAEIGSLVHRVLEQALHGKFDESMLPLKADALLAPHLSDDMVAQANAAVGAGLRFFKKHDIQIIFTERAIWSPTFGYVGTTDVLADVDGVRTVIDFKSSSGIYATMFVQLSAYSQAISEEFPETPVKQRWVVRTGKDGKLMDEMRDESTHVADFTAFKALLYAWDWDRRNDKRYPKEPLQVVGPLDRLVPRASA